MGGSRGKQATEMEKLTKWHTQNFESEKVTHKICTKNAQNRAKFAKRPKIAQKRPKTFNKCVKKKRKKAQL